MAKQQPSKTQKRELTRDEAIAEAKQRFGMDSPLTTDLIPPPLRTGLSRTEGR